VILKEQADICAGLRQEEAQWAAGTRSLHFYCMWHRLTDRQQSLDEAEQLYDDYKDYELPAELLEEIALYFERTHAFARSEDLWFDLCRIDDEAFAAKAFAFYDRIAQLPDDALAAGNLPRGEIAQGRDAIQRIVDARSAPEHPPESRGH